MKQVILTVAGVIGASLGWFLGPIDAIFIALLVSSVVDYITGIVCAINGVSEKTEGHGLSSQVGYKGILKKVVLFLVVGLLHFVEAGTGIPVRDAAVLAFLANELISIIENCGLLGIPMPQKVKDVIEVLQNDSDKS